jgi:hypothetical protein
VEGIEEKNIERKNLSLLPNGEGFVHVLGDV